MSRRISDDLIHQFVAIDVKGQKQPVYFSDRELLHDTRAREILQQQNGAMHQEIGKRNSFSPLYYLRSFFSFSCTFRFHNQIFSCPLLIANDSILQQTSLVPERSFVLVINQLYDSWFYHQAPTMHLTSAYMFVSIDLWSSNLRYSFNNSQSLFCFAKIRVALLHLARSFWVVILVSVKEEKMSVRWPVPQVTFKKKDYIKASLTA